MCEKCEESNKLLNRAGKHLARAMELRDKFSETIDSFESVEDFDSLSIDEKMELGKCRSDLSRELAMCATAIGVVGGFIDDDPASVFLGAVAGRLLEVEMAAGLLPDNLIRLMARQMGLERNEESA